MAAKQIGVTTGGNIKRYQCLTTDSTSTYPGATDCGAGSTMTVINATTHEVDGYKVFDGTNWNTL